MQLAFRAKNKNKPVPAPSGHNDVFWMARPWASVGPARRRRRRFVLTCVIVRPPRAGRGSQKRLPELHRQPMKCFHSATPDYWAAPAVAAFSVRILCVL